MFRHFSILLTALWALVGINSYAQKVSKKIICTQDSYFSMKGKIGNEPIVLHLYRGKSVTYNELYNYIHAVLEFKNSHRKIHLDGYFFYSDFVFYNYGKNHNVIYKSFKKVLEDEEFISERYSNNVDFVPYFKLKPYKYLIKFDLTKPENDKKKIKGTFTDGTSEQKITLDGNPNYGMFNFHEYYRLPNGKMFDLFPYHMSTHGDGHKFENIKYDKNENRILFRINHLSNWNPMGMCGAGEVKGYSIYHFDKNWKLKKYDEYITDACYTGDISDTVKNNSKMVKYNVSENREGYYYLTIDKINLKFIESKHYKFEKKNE